MPFSLASKLPKLAPFPQKTAVEKEPLLCSTELKPPPPKVSPIRKVISHILPPKLKTSLCSRLKRIVSSANSSTKATPTAPSNERIFDMLVKKRKSYKRRRKELVKGYEKDFNAAVGVKREWVDVLVGMSDKERRGLNYYIGRPSPLNPAPKKSASINEHADELLEKWQDARTVCRKKAFEYETMQFRLVFNIKNQRRFREMLGEKEVRRVKERVKKGKGL